MKVLSGEKVLLIAPAYHNYISNIASAFESLGAKVESYKQDPASILFTNFYLIRLEKLPLYKYLYNREVINNNRNILRSINGKQFDHVVIIKSDLLTESFLTKLRKSMPNANFVMYQWDSTNYYNYFHRIKYFNSVFSFDFADCIKNRQILYLPLFFSKDYSKIASVKDVQYEYDLFFLGNNHTIRAKKLLEMIDFFEEKGLKYSINLKTSISEKIKLGINKHQINCFFNSLKFEEFSEKYLKSRAIIDITPPAQTGLPMRIIEALGANKKIITTNQNIIKEEFYDPKMVFIWDKDNPEDLIDFLNQEYKSDCFEKFSIESFVLNLVKSR